MIPEEFGLNVSFANGYHETVRKRAKRLTARGHDPSRTSGLGVESSGFPAVPDLITGGGPGGGGHIPGR